MINYFKVQTYEIPNITRIQEGKAGIGIENSFF